ncbi:MAG: MATE family efflux transporter [Methanomassiliicoccaceae archaeon]|nr:MATE family efflux transporter [Methanomassiliicoccaceae archaeon]
MTDESMTKDVEIMLGSPKKAIMKMAVPMIIAILASSLTGLVDAAWISGLGPDSLAALGVLFPLFFIVVGVSSGISVGASSAIARHIGAGNKYEAERTASVAFTLTIVIGILFSGLMLIVARPLIMAIGGADIIDLCMEYANIMLIFATAFFINAFMSGLLRSEGNARRSMIVMVTFAILNLTLDPIFIYTMGWGLTGAAYATVVAFTIATIPAFYWYFIKKDTYLSLRIGKPHFDKKISKDIFRVGIPASVEFMAISLSVMLMNIILVSVGGTDGVAIYSSGWRILQIVMIPCLGIGSAAIPICAAAYGARDTAKVKEAFMFSIKVSLLLMTMLAGLLALSAGIVTGMFTYSAETAYLHDDMTLFIRISCIFLPFIGFGVLSSSLFQSMGMGVNALASTMFRNFIILPAAFFVSFGGTLVDIWWAVAFMEILGPVVVVIWALMVLSALTKKGRRHAHQ